MSEENKTEETIEEEVAVVEDVNNDTKKIKNLTSIVILLGGLFVGSLFVDFSQLIKGGGISQKVLNNKDVFQLDGKTWVAYSDPMIDVTIINDETCEECNVDEIVLSLRKVMPTMLSNKVEYSSEEGKKLIEDFGIKSLPAFVFGKEVEETDLFEQAKAIFVEKNGKYAMDSAKAGLPIGKYLQTPTIGENVIKFGPDDAKVKLVEFSDFQCPYCQLFQKTMNEIVAEYGDKVQFVFKNLPLEAIHPRAKAAAMAAECANEQGKFMEYSDKLFANQKIWGETKDNKAFIGYASQLKLNTAQFTQCVTDEKYKDKIESDLKEANDFGISGTPAIFINDKFKNGAVDAAELKSIIDEELNGGEGAESTESEETVEETK
ncbi:MAG: DsbA family protein [Candidatus Moraniibacteriota bacterium]